MVLKTGRAELDRESNDRERGSTFRGCQSRKRGILSKVGQAVYKTRVPHYRRRYYPRRVYLRISGSTASRSPSFVLASVKCEDPRCASSALSSVHSSTNVKSVGSALF